MSYSHSTIRVEHNAITLLHVTVLVRFLNGMLRFLRDKHGSKTILFIRVK